MQTVKDNPIVKYIKAKNAEEAQNLIDKYDLHIETFMQNCISQPLNQLILDLTFEQKLKVLDALQTRGSSIRHYEFNYSLEYELQWFCEKHDPRFKSYSKEDYENLGLYALYVASPDFNSKAFNEYMNADLDDILRSIDMQFINEVIYSLKDYYENLRVFIIDDAGTSGALWTNTKLPFDDKEILDERFLTSMVY